MSGAESVPPQRPTVPLFVQRPVLEPLIPEIAERQRRVLESGRYILGPEVDAFEREFAEYIGRRHCIGVGNGTDALTITLRALGVGLGDEVIVPAFTFFATAEAVVNAGATPVFADLDPRTDALAVDAVAAAITERTRAVIPVHLFGNPAPLGELEQVTASRGISIVEDAAQAAGARLGSRRAGAIGTAACFSFYPGKNLGAFGDAGAIVVDDDDLAATARRLRDHGSERRWVHRDIGFNSRLDELQAAGLRVLLPHLDGWTDSRRRVAARYEAAGLGDAVVTPPTTAAAEHAYHLYVVRHPARDALADRLMEAGIETRAYYTPALPRQPALAAYANGREYPVADSLAEQGLALPMGPGLDDETVDAVVAATARSLESLIARPSR